MLAALGCRPDCTPRSGETRPSVVLVTIDTLRADHLGTYGNSRVRTPELDRLAAEGAVFTRAYSQTHVTLPSHLSILSSLPVADHGLESNLAGGSRPVTTLPALFKQAGYRTAAFVGSKHLGPTAQLGAVLTGLDVYDAPRRGSAPRRADETNGRFSSWLRGSCRDPFFAWLHYWDPHMPYAPPAPYDSTYYTGDPRAPAQDGLDPAMLSWFFHDLRPLRARMGAHASEVQALKRALGTNSRGVKRLLLYREGVVPGADLAPRVDQLSTTIRRTLPYAHPLASWLHGIHDLAFARAQYAGEVSYVDREIGRLRDLLVERGLAERTILVVTGDHGESLGQHAVYFDHFGLYEPDVRVPLIVWAPGRVEPGRRSNPVRGIDVAPTILRLAGLATPPAMQGRDALTPGDDDVVLEATRGLQLGLVRGRWKLIRTLKPFYYVEAYTRAADAVELYDLEADPSESTNLADLRPEVTAELGARLDAWHAAHRGVDGAVPATLPADQRNQLRALGYVE